MFTKDLNRELGQVLGERNKKKAILAKKTGLSSTDDEDEEITTTKSLKSPKSPISSRSSMLSAKSPRDDTSPFFNTTKNPFIKNTRFDANSKKLSDSENEEESQKSSSRLQMWNHDRKQSPKSPKSDRSDSSSPRRLLSSRNLNRFDQDNDQGLPSPGPLKGVKSPRLEKNDNFMLTTLKKPLNTDKFRKGNKIDEIDEELTPRLENKRSPKSLAKLQIDSPRLAEKYKKTNEPEDEKEHFRNILGGGSGGGTKTLKPLSPTSRNRNINPLILKKPNELVQQKPNKSPPLIKKEAAPIMQSPKNSRPTTPVARDDKKLHLTDSQDHRTSFDKSSALLDGLLPELKTKPVPILRKQSEDKKQSHADEPVDQHPDHNKPKNKTHTPFELSTDLHYEYEKQLSDVDRHSLVDEKIEDSNITEKLKKQREEKTRLRLERAKTQTDTTKLLESAIEKVEFANEDEIRLKRLTDQSDSLNYASKPRLDKTQILTQDIFSTRSRSRDVQSNGIGRSMRTRSLSGSKSNRYKHVKPKLVTRLDSAGSLNGSRMSKNDIENDFDDESKPMFHDTEAMRGEVYRRWYEKKMAADKENLKQQRESAKDQEEKKAHELIKKLQKSQLMYKLWDNKKQAELNKKSQQEKELAEKIKEELFKRREKKQIAEKSFKKWKESKDYDLQQKMSEQAKQMKAIKQAKQEIDKKKRDAEKQYQIWKAKKEAELEKKLAESHNTKGKKDELSREAKMELNRKAYEEWLEKKEEQLANQDFLSRSLSTSAMNASLPPFYPTSRTISYRR